MERMIIIRTTNLTYCENDTYAFNYSFWFSSMHSGKGGSGFLFNFFTANRTHMCFGKLPREHLSKKEHWGVNWHLLRLGNCCMAHAVSIKRNCVSFKQNHKTYYRFHSLNKKPDHKAKLKLVYLEDNVTKSVNNLDSFSKEQFMEDASSGLEGGVQGRSL